MIELSNLTKRYGRFTAVDGINLAGDAYVNLGHYLTARDTYRKVLEKDPANKHANDALVNLQALGYM